VLKRDLIEARVGECRSLPSLTRNAQDIIRLVNAGQTNTHQICDIVQRDPSLTARVLRMVNSVYFGLAEPVTSIEQAVFFVGTEQIRHLAMATPVIEDFQKLAGNTPFPWRPFWQHCIAVALLTREIISSLVAPNDQSDYVAGLVHDVGKIVMAAAFPKHFLVIHRRVAEEPAHLPEVERTVLGMDHMELGGLYLRRMNFPAVLVEAAQFHHAPENARHEPAIAAAVQIANLVIRKHQLGCSGELRPVSLERCLAASGWNILAPTLTPEGRATAYAGWIRTLDTMPSILEAIV
jgi:putative nucleotidyltransferase with HDIG domain